LAYAQDLLVAIEMEWVGKLKHVFEQVYHNDWENSIGDDWQVRR
jgi:hypothetical protein